MTKKSNNKRIPSYNNLDKFSPIVRRLTANNPSPFTLYGTGTYIIGKKEICIIDPGPKLSSHIENIFKTIDKDLITHILITHTHADHSPAAQAIKKITKAKTYGYGPYPKSNTNNQFEEGHDVNFTPDVLLKDGDVLKGKDWTIKAIHTPGHTSNHMCYGLDEDSILFTGDHVMGWATTVIIPPDGNMTDYVHSLKKILRLDYIKYFPTHGDPILEPKKYVRALIAHRKMREKQILEELKLNSLCLEEMVPRFYASTKKQLWKAAEKSLLATLLSLEEAGKIFCNNKGKNSKWILKKTNI